jgi:phosphatidate cytidylyltransferase
LALGNLAQRFLVAVVAVPILLVILYFHRPEPTWALIFAASLLAMRELFGMLLPQQDRGPALVMGAIACAAFYWFDPIALSPYHSVPGALQRVSFEGSAIAAAFAVVVPCLYYLFRFRDIPSVAGRIAGTITGIVYAGFLTTYLAKLKLVDPRHAGDTVLIVLVVAWLADTGGYFAGRFIGGAKLYEAVSPKKTWAGAYGGIVGSVVGVAALKLIHASYLSWLDVGLLAIPGGILGQMGDLAESLIKRSVGVKDSGALLPGHGGILDRIDAVLFIAPYVYTYLLARGIAG